MEASEDGPRFHLNSTDCEKQEIIQGTLRTGVCCKYTIGAGTGTTWEPKEMRGLVVISSYRPHDLLFISASLNICFLKIWLLCGSLATDSKS